MNINDEVFYQMMGDYHYYMCGYYWLLYQNLNSVEYVNNQYCVGQASYHHKKYVNYDEVYYG